MITDRVHVNMSRVLKVSAKLREVAPDGENDIAGALDDIAGAILSMEAAISASQDVALRHNNAFSRIKDATSEFNHEY